MGRFKMENDRLVVTIDDLGAELVSIYDKKYSRELIWQGDPAWWKRQAPILFPNVGKFYGGEYLYQGRHLCAGSAWFCQRLCVGNELKKVRLL